MKPTVYRRVGMLPKRKETRSFIASQLKQWRAQGKVRRHVYPDGRVYQPEDQHNPYTAIVLT